MQSKKAQAWSLDIVIASFIFVTGVMILFFYAINYTNQSQGHLDDLFYQGNSAAELILSDGEFGILSENKINQSKLDDFYNLNYDSKKSQLNLKDDFYFIIDELEIQGQPVEYVGKMSETPVENLIKINRFTLYKNKPVKFQLYVWR